MTASCLSADDPHYMCEILNHYFPDISEEQRKRLEQLPDLYREWNAKINVISRKDIDNIVPNHILHSLSIAKFIHFKPETQVLDIGTGGGFPGIPLAIIFPDAHFTLIDSIGKKIKVVSEIAGAIGLENVEWIHGRAEEAGRKCHFVVSRAAMSMSDLYRISRKCVDNKEQFNALPNGVIALKGGNLTEELRPFKRTVTVDEVSQYFPESAFEEKKIVYLPI